MQKWSAEWQSSFPIGYFRKSFVKDVFTVTYQPLWWKLFRDRRQEGGGGEYFCRKNIFLGKHWQQSTKEDGRKKREEETSHKWNSCNIFFFCLTSGNVDWKQTLISISLDELFYKLIVTKMNYMPSVLKTW